MPLHNAFAVKYGASTIISGLQQLDTQLNPTVEAESSSGTPYPQFAVITGQDPRIMFSTKQVGAVLGITGLNGGLIDDTNGLTAYMAKLGANGLAMPGNVHRSYAISRGLLVPRRLVCPARGNVSVDAEALVYSTDGNTHPVALADNVALPTMTLNNILHTIGLIVLGSGTTITPNCIQNVSIDFGNGAGALGCGGDLYNTHLQVPRTAPIITLTGIDAGLFAATGGVPPVGMPLTHAGTKIFFRKRKADGVGFVSDATAEHIKLTVFGVAVVTSHTAQGNERGEVTVQITTAFEGTNAPITINTASAIA